jgi:hypothetical protein
MSQHAMIDLVTNHLDGCDQLDHLDGCGQLDHLDGCVRGPFTADCVSAQVVSKNPNLG